MSAVSTPASAARPRPRGRLRGALAWLGAATLREIAWGTRVSALAALSLWRIGPGLRRLRRVTREVLVRQVLFTGVEALPFTGLIAALVGSIVIVEAQRAILDASGSGVLTKLLVVVLVRELGPLVAGIVVTGRSGVALTVELGNMRVSGEIDALEAQGVDPVEHLVVPRVAAFALSLTSLGAFFVIVSMLVGVLASGLVAGAVSSPLEIVDRLAQAVSPTDALAFVAKTFVPGALVAAVATYEGLSAGPDPTDVPRAASRSMMRALALLFAINAAVSAAVLLT